jgi:hypothetical protein
VPEVSFYGCDGRSSKRCGRGRWPPAQQVRCLCNVNCRILWTLLILDRRARNVATSESKHKSHIPAFCFIKITIVDAANELLWLSLSLFAVFRTGSPVTNSGRRCAAASFYCKPSLNSVECKTALNRHTQFTVRQVHYRLDDFTSIASLGAVVRLP